jgi:DNA-binding MarR family transcriptional regulator
MSSQEVGDLLMALSRQWKLASPVRRGRVTQEQYWVLKTLNEEGPLRVKDLATKLGCTSGSASITLKRMEREGLVDRERNKADERVVTVELAGKGRERLAWWRGEQLRSVSALFDSLTSTERNELVRLLEKGLAGKGLAVQAPRGGAHRR